MNRHVLGRRVYGVRYDRTRVIKTLNVLADRILADLSQSVGSDIIPLGVVFSARVKANVLLHIQVGGLSDGFTFADLVSWRYSDAANALIDRIGRIVESYNWTNLDDLRDRRFVPSVCLLAEVDYRTIFWTPGAVRAF